MSKGSSDSISLSKDRYPEYFKMALSGSRLAELLVPRKNIDISVKPVKENEMPHMVQAVTKDHLNAPLWVSPANHSGSVCRTGETVLRDLKSCNELPHSVMRAKTEETCLSFHNSSQQQKATANGAVAKCKLSTSYGF